jgi:hypothetical protein
MLQFLVTSKARRRLLLLLWGERVHGSVSELASRAGVAFSTAHTELKAMQRLQLVSSRREGANEVFSANRDHPDFEVLGKLVESETKKPAANHATNEAVRELLVGLGAPLRGVHARTTTAVVETLVSGCELARRDSVVARTLPICCWKQRDKLDGAVLSELVAPAETKHTFAFFLELAGELGGDRRLAGLAEGLRDRRLTQPKPFFHSARTEMVRDFPLAAKWGFQMNTDLESFRALFDKFVR